MATEPSDKSQHPKIDVGGINLGGGVGGNFVVGSGNVINFNPEQIRISSLHQLPPAPPDFTGRETELKQVFENLTKNKGTAISGLSGMGGIGKTTLGLVVAHQIASKYPDAQIFLDLKGTTEPLSASDIARYVILSFEPSADLRNLDESNMRAAYQSILHNKKALLYFDNARSAAQIVPLTPPDSCALLVTSRWTFAMPGLSFHKVGTLNEQEAVDFLLGLCPRVGSQAKELAKACAYLPLALRIAGGFLQVNSDLGIVKYLSQLSDRKTRLETLRQSHDDVEIIEADLRAAFDLSYAALSEADRMRWRMLGVSPASFASSVAQAMWGFEAGDATKILSLLRRYGLLEFDENSSRYNLHDLLSDYALSQMDAMEEQEARLKHAAYQLEIMKVANNLYLEGGGKILQGLRLFDLEWEHIRVAQAWLKADVERSKEIMEMVMLYPDASKNCLDLRLTPKQRIEWLLPALDIARKLGNKKYQGKYLNNLGLVHKTLGEIYKAIEFYEQALRIDREMGNRLGEASVLSNLGNAYEDLGELQEAIAFFEQALVIGRETGDRRREGARLCNLGLAYSYLGEIQKAIELYEQALDIDREFGDRLGEGADLGNLGLAYAALGETRKAIEFYEQQLVIDRELGERLGEGNALLSMGLAYVELGENQNAIEFYEQTLRIYGELGYRLGEGLALYFMGLAFYNVGQRDQAINLVRQAIKIFEEIGSRNAEEAREKLRDWGMLE